MTHNTASRYADSPSEVAWRDWKSAGAKAGLNVLDENISLRCAGVAFFGVLSLFPAVATGVLLLGLFVNVSTLQDNLDALSTLFPSSVYDMLTGQISAVGGASDTSLGLGLLFTVGLGLWSGSRGINALIGLVGVTYREKNERGVILSAVISILFLLAAAVFTAVFLSVIAVVPVLLELVPAEMAWMGSLVGILRWPAIAFFAFAAIAGLYRFAPHRRSAQWRWILPGAAVSALLWLLASALFSIYVDRFADYNATFGSIATAVVLLLWFYYSVLAISLGAELNAQLELLTRRDFTAGPARPMGKRGAYVADNVISGPR